LFKFKTRKLVIEGKRKQTDDSERKLKKKVRVWALIVFLLVFSTNSLSSTSLIKILRTIFDILPKW